jgi:hypothetical protein
LLSASSSLLFLLFLLFFVCVFCFVLFSCCFAFACYMRSLFNLFSTKTMSEKDGRSC